MPRHVVGVFLVVAALLVLSGCRPSGPAGKGTDPHIAVEGALTSLERQTAVGYGFPAGGTFTVARSGLARGTLTLKDQQVPALRVGGNLYLRAPTGYWEAQGMPAERAAGYGSRWARSTLALDPGVVLAPDGLARALRAAIPAGAQAERLTLGDGTELFDVDGLQVTAAEPYRVTSFRPSLLGPAGPPVLGNTAVEVRAVGADGLAGLRTGLGGDVDGLGQPFVAGPVVATKVTQNSLRCTAGGACTDSVHVENELIGEGPQALARLVMKSSVTSSPLGTRECGQELVTPLNGSVTMSCAVKFDLPRANGAAKVSAVPTVTAEPVAVVDVASMKQEIATALGT